MGDAERLEDLGAGGVVVAPEEEEVLEHLCGEGGLVPRRGALHLRQLQPVAADLALLVLVVVPADPARVLPLPLPHLEPCPALRKRSELEGSRSVLEVGRRARAGKASRDFPRIFFLWGLDRIDGVGVLSSLFRRRKRRGEI